MFISLFTLIFYPTIKKKKIITHFINFIYFYNLFFIFFYQIIQTMFTNDIIHFYGIMGSSLTYGIFENPPRSSGGVLDSV